MKRFFLFLLLLSSSLCFGVAVTVKDSPDCKFSRKGRFTCPSTGTWIKAYFTPPTLGSVLVNGVPHPFKSSQNYFLPSLASDYEVSFEKGRSAYLTDELGTLLKPATTDWQAIRFCSGAEFPSGCTDFLFPYDADGYIVRALGGTLYVCQTNDFTRVIPTMYGSYTLQLSAFTIENGGTLHVGRSLSRLMFMGSGYISVTGVKNEKE